MKVKVNYKQMNMKKDTTDIVSKKTLFIRIMIYNPGNYNCET